MKETATSPEMPPLPETLEECHKTLENMWRWLHNHSHIFVGDTRWNDGFWTYEADGKLFCVPAFKKGQKIACINWDKGIIFAGTVGDRDEVDRGHAHGSEIV